jgi:hypothetical protein
MIVFFNWLKAVIPRWEARDYPNCLLIIVCDFRGMVECLPATRSASTLPARREIGLASGSDDQREVRPAHLLCERGDANAVTIEIFRSGRQSRTGDSSNSADVWRLRISASTCLRVGSNMPGSAPGLLLSS